MRCGITRCLALVSVTAVHHCGTDVMNFGGLAPELVNARLAMLGFVAAIAAEWRTGTCLMFCNVWFVSSSHAHSPQRADTGPDATVAICYFCTGVD